MLVVKLGDSKFRKNKKGSFFFHCKRCGCKWYANSDDKGLNFSPLDCKFYTYMDCPNCYETTYDREKR